jgi:plasmid maintenance system antidote protein VapI
MNKSKDADILKPKFSYGLKAKIISEGYWTLTEFSEKIGVSVSRVSRVVSGWELPGAELQKSIADTLGITLSDLAELLNPNREAA